MTSKRRWKAGALLHPEWTRPTSSDCPGHEYSLDRISLVSYHQRRNGYSADSYAPTYSSIDSSLSPPSRARLPIMFAGEYLCKVDDKGRFLIPSPLRERLEAEGNQVMFVKNTEQTLWMYSAKEWEKVLERTRITLDEDQSRLFMHHVMSQAGTSDIDKAGRVLIPSRLRKLVPMDEDQEIFLVGMYHRLEVWGPSEWRRYLTRTEDRYEQDMAKIQNLL
ncbi:MAG: hypothetical protein CCU27_11695 [Nitrospira sp. UW-LDO-02]|nr:MAG: hypothetical protein CCU27_11695 [Nitrospira sp. UW-LDO-02]HAN48624.1 hypothetical protein [Nitrospira sp.]